MLSDAEFTCDNRGIHPKEISLCEVFTWFTLDLRKVVGPDGLPMFPELQEEWDIVPLWKVARRYKKTETHQDRGVVNPYGRHGRALTEEEEEERQQNLARYASRGWAFEQPV